MIRVHAFALALLAARSHPDSIRNGADDDGSGVVALLAVARALAGRADRPRHSVLFVWHAGEELGFLGSRWLSDHLPVPADSVIALLNLDMFGRGDSSDVAGGGPGYLQVIGAGGRSSVLPAIIDSVAADPRFGLRLERSFDPPDHPLHYYCRSDHLMYGRLGIPVAFFTTGPHRDYHQVTDEARYIDWGKLARVSDFVAGLTARLADERPLPHDVPLTAESRCGF